MAVTNDCEIRHAPDATVLAVLYGCGLRRGELARLDLDNFDSDDGSILVQGKRGSSVPST